MRTAAEVLEKEINAVTDEERSWAKLSTSASYTASAGLAWQGTPALLKTSRAVYQKYLNRYPKVKATWTKLSTKLGKRAMLKPFLAEEDIFQK